MTREEIIAMAQECQLIGMRPHLDGIYQEFLERFAAEIAAAEREACAKVCESYIAEGIGREMAEAIRARGQAITAIREALAERFCDNNCTWLDHHPECDKAEQPIKQEPVATGKQFLQVEELLKDMLDTLPYNSPDYWISRIKEVLPLYASPQASKPWVGLTDEEIDLFINGRGDEGDEEYVEPTGDDFGLTEADLVQLVRRSEAKLKEKNG